MEEPAETSEETKHSGGFTAFMVWVGVVLVLYVLSLGPVLMMFEKGIMSRQARRPFGYFYLPLIWTYQSTPLRKPLGMYYHLWCPQVFDKNGEPPNRPH